MKNSSLIPIERVEQAILLIRGEKVILDADLAKLYGVSTKRLNEQVKRNRERFPEDFMFQLTIEEARSSQRLRSQFATHKVSTFCFHRTRRHHRGECLSQ